MNVIERNRSDCKYVEIFTHRVGSIGAPSRRTVCIIIIIIIIIISDMTPELWKCAIREALQRRQSLDNGC
jgi:hypothetical protein